MVSFEEAGPPIASHAPVTITTNRALALSQGFENGSLAPPGMAKGRRRALAVGVGVLFVAIGAWRLNMRNGTLRASPTTVEPISSPTAAPAPTPGPIPVPPDQTFPPAVWISYATYYSRSG